MQNQHDDNGLNSISNNSFANLHLRVQVNAGLYFWCPSDTVTTHHHCARKVFSRKIPRIISSTLPMQSRKFLMLQQFVTRLTCCQLKWTVCKHQIFLDGKMTICEASFSASGRVGKSLVWAKQSSTWMSPLSCFHKVAAVVTLHHLWQYLWNSLFRGNQRFWGMHMIWKRSSSPLQCTFEICLCRERNDKDYVFKKTAFKHLLPVKMTILCILLCYKWCHRKLGFTRLCLASLLTLPTTLSPCLHIAF